MRWKKLSVIILGMTMLVGCQRINPVTVTPTYEEEQIEAILTRATISDPATVYTPVNVYEKTISLVLEGFSDETTMMRLADLLEERKVEAIMFIPGIMVESHPDVIEYIKDRGVSLGNYGITGEEDLGSSTDTKIARQVYMANAYYKQAIKYEPEYFYANRSEYTESMLKIVDAAGLDGVVKPNIFLNVKSFTNQEVTTNYTKYNLRGDIVTFKLNGEFNETEVNTTKELDDEPAIDKQPTIIDEEVELEVPPGSDHDIVDVLEWFLTACEINQVNIVSLKELESEAQESLEPREVEEELMEQLDMNLYPNLTTDFQFGVQESEKVDHSYFDQAVFVGDSIMEYIEDYVIQKRQSNSDYLGTAQFLAMGGLSARNALWPISEESRHPIYNGQRVTVQDGVAAMGNIQQVYLLLGSNDILLTDTQEHLDNYQTLLQLIRSQSPQVEFYIISITPGTDIEELEPNNTEIFERNLALIEWCAMYGYEYIDVAYALRNERGALPTEWCVDTGGQGFHFNEEGIDRFWEYIYTHTK